MSSEVTQEEFREKIKGEQIKDIGVSARGTHIDVVLDDGEPYSTITVRGNDLEWEISEVRSVDTDGDSDV